MTPEEEAEIIRLENLEEQEEFTRACADINAMWRASKERQVQP